jgi:hypothetical protein
LGLEIGSKHGLDLFGFPWILSSETGFFNGLRGSIDSKILPPPRGEWGGNAKPFPAPEPS